MVEELRMMEWKTMMLGDSGQFIWTNDGVFKEHRLSVCPTDDPFQTGFCSGVQPHLDLVGLATHTLFPMGC